MKVSGEIILVTLLFAGLIAIMFFVLPRLTPDTSSDTPYSTYSDYSDGTKVFYDLLKKFDFHVTRIRVEPYTLPDDLAVLFLLQPDDTLADEARDEMQAFVERGGILIAAGTRHLDTLLLDYGLEMVKAEKRLNASQRLHPEPLFPRMPVGRFISSTDVAILPAERHIAPLFGNESDYSIVTFRVERGRIFVLSCPYIFTSAGLGHPENAKLIYNLLAYLPPKSKIGFDEYHHGFRLATEGHEGNPLLRLFLSTPIGWAVLYAGMLIFIFLILEGRRFGQPIEADNSHQRLSSEYVFAMAHLYQKGGKRTAILEHIRNEFRLHLATRWDINPMLDTPSFVAEIARRQSIDADELQALLDELDKTTPLSETRLLALAKRVEAYCDKGIGRTRRDV